MFHPKIKLELKSLNFILSACAGALLAAADAQAAFSVKLIPVATRAVNPPYGVSDLAVSGNRAYLACKNAGFAIYDISNPESPQPLGMPNPGVVDYVSVAGNYAYCSLHNGDVKVVDVSNPPNCPVVFTSYLSSSESFPLNGCLHLVGANGGLRIFDLQNPAVPAVLTTYFDLPSDALWGLHAQGDYVYATGGNSGLYIVNVANRAGPWRVSTFNTSYSAREIFVQGRYAYVGGWKSYDNGLRIIDLADPASPRELPGYGWTIGEPLAVCVTNGLAFVGEHEWYAGKGQVTVFDVGNPGQPRGVGYGETDDYLYDMEVAGDYVFVAQMGNGFKVFRLEYAGLVAPVFTRQPQDVRLTAGQTASFNTAATGDPVPRLQWQRSTDGGAQWQDLSEGAGFSGTDSTNLSFSATMAMNGSLWRTVATSVAGTNVTGTATLAVSGVPLITAQPQPRQVLAGQSATFSVAAIGAPSLSYQWRLGETPVPGATNATLVLTNISTTQAGGYAVVVGNSYGAVTSVVATLTIVPVLTLPIALDAPTLTWTSGGAAPWTAQTIFQHDGFAAARSGVTPHGQQSYLDTVVEGPGILSFWWKVSSEAGYDGLAFYLSGTVKATLSGNLDWQQKTFPVPPGSQSLRWSYIKDWSTSAGSDAGWLDEVTFTSTRPYLTGPAFDNGAFSTSFGTLSGSNYVLEYKNSLTQSNWTVLRTVTGDGAAQVFTDTPGNASQRFYRVRLE